MKRRPRPTLRLLALTLAIALAGGCTVGPDYVRPSAAEPASFKELAGWLPAQPQDRETRGKWWEIFGDAQLDTLAEQVIAANQNLKVAEAQYRQAQALAAQARSGLFPLVTSSASVQRSRLPGSPSSTSTQHTLSFDASWEPDLWGRVRRTVESGDASVAASAADLESARLSLIASLAQNYFQLRAADTQQQLLDETVVAYTRALELVRNRYKAGVASKADVAQAETQLKTTQAAGIDVGVGRAQLEHAIAVLAGKAPSEWTIEPARLTSNVPIVPAGLPSELLQRRPDIAAAERRVAAANAQIGVAKAAFFPSLTLSASAGFQSSSFANWLSAPSRFWALGPALAQTLFDAGLRRAQTDQAIAAYDQAVASYRQTVLNSFQEIEDNLAALRLLQQEAAIQDEAVKSAQESVTLLTNQYKAGTVSYADVVTVQAAALANQRSAVDIRNRQLVAAVILIRALGGSWDHDTRTVVARRAAVIGRIGRPHITIGGIVDRSPIQPVQHSKCHPQLP